ncbi:MAG: TonB-dependent receptor, partial [Asticcacaulis sp.]
MQTLLRSKLPNKARNKARTPLCVLLFSLSVSPLSPAISMAADDQRQSYAQSPQPLSLALQDVSRKTGLVVVAPSHLVNGKTTSGLRGAYTPEQALSHLLAGTGLAAKKVSATSFVLVRVTRPNMQPAQQAAPAKKVRPLEVIVTANSAQAPPRIRRDISGDRLSPERLAFSATSDLSQALSQNIPAIAMQTYGRDAANNTPSVRLRDLSPNDTLVLVNGKRRHGTSSLSVIASPFQGGVSADFRLIPLSLIDHVEVLTDGLAGSYGSDAIAGVVNIVLKTHQTGASLTTSTGAYFDGGGDTADLAANMSVINTSSAFLQVSFQTKFHDYSQRGAVDPRVLNYPELKTHTDYPYLNKVVGDGAYRLNVFGFNAGRDLNAQWQAYGFGIFGFKTASSRENWRTPDRLPDLFPEGFTPHEAVNEQDSDLTLGLRGQMTDWAIDAALSRGTNRQDISNYGGANISLYADTGATPTRFYIGRFTRNQFLFNLDAHRDFSWDATRTLALSLGLEVLKDSYGIEKGDAASIYKEGAQGFPGFSAQDAGRYQRKAGAAYLDMSYDDKTRLKLNAGGRIEQVDGFKAALIGRFSARLAMTPNLALRLSLSNGWRAPSLAESNYSATNVSPIAATLQLPPGSEAIRSLG